MSTIPTELTAVLVGDRVTFNGIPGYPASPTQVGGVNVSAVIECQSTTRAFLLPRMTTAQRDAIAVPFNGMMIYNTTTDASNTYEGGAWGAGGGGDVDGPGGSTNQGLAAFDGVTGKLLQATTVLLNPATSVISAIGGLFNAAGTAAVPTYSFTGDTDTGVYRPGANQIGFATAGVLQAVITGGATTVNTLEIEGSPTGTGPFILASGTDPNIDINLEATQGAIRFYSDTTDQQVSIENTPSAVNRITLTGSVANTAAVISTVGASATIPIIISPKNNASVFINTGTTAAPGLAFTGGAPGTTSGISLNSGGTARTNWVATSVSGSVASAVNGNGVLAIGSTTFDATMTNGLQLSAGTAPTGQASTLQIYAATIGGNLGALGLQIPAGSLTASVDNVVTNKVQIKVNGTTYYLLATTSAA